MTKHKITNGLKTPIEFGDDRNTYGTLGAIQKFFISARIPDDDAISLLAETNMDIPMRAIEMMSDKPVFEMLYGMQLGYHHANELVNP